MADFARSADPGVQQQLDRLAKLSPIGDRLGLDRIAALLDRLGRPQDLVPPVFHVAGTNGKGSTCAFLRAGLEAAGHKVHMFTSPHLVRFNERIRIAGKLIGDRELAGLLEEVHNHSAGIEPSFFEVATAVALLSFARTPADACILEVGLGGRLDATNVIEHPLVCGIASIGLDHQHFLGDSLGEIAGEKASIAKRGVPLVSVVQQLEAEAAIARVARERGAPLLIEGRDWTADQSFVTALPGQHQLPNANLAWQMLAAQDRLSVSDAQFRRGLTQASWPARLQRLKPGPLTGTSETWLDGGHNPAAARHIADFARANFADGKPLHLVFASLATKDPRGMLKPFVGLVSHVHCVPIPDHDCLAADELMRIAMEMGFAAHAFAAVHEAVAAVPENARLLIFGSLYLAGVVLAANDEVPD